MISRGLLAVLFGQVKLSCFTQKNEADLSVRWQKMPTHQQQSQQKNQPQKNIFFKFHWHLRKIFFAASFNLCLSLLVWLFFFFFFAYVCVSTCGLTDDSYIVLNLEQGFLATLGQHAESITVVCVV